MFLSKYENLDTWSWYVLVFIWIDNGRWYLIILLLFKNQPFFQDNCVNKDHVFLRDTVCWEADICSKGCVVLLDYI